jgi:hypothetical protein
MRSCWSTGELTFLMRGDEEASHRASEMMHIRRHHRIQATCPQTTETRLLGALDHGGCRGASLGSSGAVAAVAG